MHTYHVHVRTSNAGDERNDSTRHVWRCRREGDVCDFSLVQVSVRSPSAVHSIQALYSINVQHNQSRQALPRLCVSGECQRIERISNRHTLSNLFGNTEITVMRNQLMLLYVNSMTNESQLVFSCVLSGEF